MNLLHINSVLSISYNIPVLLRLAEQPYGMMFGECKAGANIPFDKDVAFHLLFILKGSAYVNVGGKEIDIYQNEFLMVDSDLPVNCVCTRSSHYVIISLDKPLPTGTNICTEWTPAQPHTIPTGVSVLLRYMLPTMPLNEKLNHYLLPRIVCSIIRAAIT